MSSSVSADIPLHHSLASDVKNDCEKAVQIVNKLKKQLEDDDSSTADGLSFLDLKNHMMTSYVANLSYIMLKKSFGKSIKDDPAIKRLTEIRTVMEKMRPIEQKLRYQIDKSIKVAESGEIKKDDPLHFKPNPSALISKLGDEEDSSEEEDEGEAGETSKTGKYVVPKNVPMYFDDQSREDVERENLQKARKTQLSRGMIEELKLQHQDAPEEIFSQVDTMKKKQIEMAKERTRFEEENFIRLNVSKKDKHKRRQMTTMGTIADEVTNFGTNVFDGDGGPRGKKRKGKSGKKGKAKKKFRK